MIMVMIMMKKKKMMMMIGGDDDDIVDVDVCHVGDVGDDEVKEGV